MASRIGSERRVAHARHQFLGARTGRSRQRVSRMPKVVESEPEHARSSERTSPMSVEGLAVERLAERPRKDDRILSGSYEPLHVRSEVRHEGRGKADRPRSEEHTSELQSLR